MQYNGRVVVVGMRKKLVMNESDSMYGSCALLRQITYTCVSTALIYSAPIAIATVTDSHPKAKVNTEPPLGNQCKANILCGAGDIKFRWQGMADRAGEGREGGKE